MKKPRTNPDGLMSYREYADHRSCSVAAVRDAIKSGRIDFVQHGRHKYINQKDADQKWALNTDESKQNNVLSINEQGVTYNKARAMREAYQAKLAKLEFEEKSGRLIDAEQVKRDAFELARRVRDSLLNIPSRVSSQIITFTDPVDAEEMLETEIRKALKIIADE